MKTLHVKDSGKSFRDIKSGLKVTLEGIPKRLDPKKADAGFFVFPDGTKATLGAGVVEPWTDKDEAAGYAIKPASKMTIRELAAMKAMEGLLAGGSTTDPKKIGPAAVQHADSLLNSLSTPS